MKNLAFKPLNLLYNFLVAFVLLSFLFGATPIVAGSSLAVATVSGTALSVSNPFKEMNFFMAIQVEIWQNHIEEEIFKDNAFLRKSFNADQYVLSGKVVHIPQSGGSGNVVKNRTTLPATVRKRTDTDVVYVLNEFTTDPVLIPNADTHELSYDKRQSVLGEDRDAIVEAVAEDALLSWLKTPAYGTYNATVLPGANILETSGGAVAATAPNATGNRKKAQITDLQRMQTFFRQKRRWFDGRMNAMLPPQMIAELFPADSQLTATYMQNVTEAERRMGILFKVQGWNIMSRSSVVRVAADGTFKENGALGVTTDDEAALFWYDQAVEFGFGGVVAFENEKDATFYGDVYSFLARSGGRARRADYGGIALLKQAKTA